MLDKSMSRGNNDATSVTMRIRVEFSKTEAMRFTSHLDLYRAWERLLRRAGLPLIFSQGYNPRPKLQLAAPLPLGITSRVEIIDFWLSDGPYELDELKSRLAASQPPGIEIQSVDSVDPSAPPLQKKVSAAEYQVQLLDHVPQLDKQIEILLASEAIIRQRRGKTYDLRPLVQKIIISNGESTHLHMQLNAKEGSTGRPEEVLLALGIRPEDTLIERVKLVI
jgi:radical SAM-linked protein